MGMKRKIGHTRQKTVNLAVAKVPGIFKLKNNYNKNVSQSHTKLLNSRQILKPQNTNL